MREFAPMNWPQKREISMNSDIRVCRPSPLLAVAVIPLLALTLASRPASATWPPFGRAVCSADGSQVHPAIATDGADGAVIAWQDHRSPRVNLFAAHVLASGEVDATWPANGQ